MNVFEVLIEITGESPEVKQEQHFVSCIEYIDVANHFDRYCNELSYDETLYQIKSIRYILTVSQAIT